MFVHIAANCVLAGGSNNKIVLRDFAGISACCAVYSGTEMFDKDITTIIPLELLQNRNTFHGDVVFEKHTCLGANSVMMSGNTIPEGTVIGANSFVPINFNFEPWSVYVGNPIKKIKERQKDIILEKEKEVIEKLQAKLLYNSGDIF